MKSVQLLNDVYQRAAQLAEADHVSVDRLVAALVNEGIGDWARVQVPADQLKPILSKVCDAPADTTDRM